MRRWIPTLDVHPVDVVATSIEVPSLRRNPNEVPWIPWCQFIRCACMFGKASEKEIVRYQKVHEPYVTWAPRSDCQWTLEDWSLSLNEPKWIRVPDCVVEIPDECFRKGVHVEMVTFGANSSLRRIGEHAFSRSQIKSICIPKSVTEIGRKAFARCRQMQTVLFVRDSSLQRIGEMAFLRCVFQDIVLPDSVATIGRECFAYSEIRYVRFSSNSKLVSIGDNAFAASRLKEFVVPSSVVEIGELCFDYSHIKHLVFHQDSKLCRIVNGPMSRSLKYFSVPDSVKEIGKFALSGVSLVTFGVHSSLEIVGSSVFCETHARENWLPPSITHIPDGCYSNCRFLQVAFQPNVAIREVMFCAFWGCNMLQEIVIPDTVVTLGDACFLACQQLRSVKWGENPAVATIGIQAFAATSISEFRFPGTVSSVGGGLFNNCELPNLDVSAVPDKLAIQGPFLLSSDLMTLYGMLTMTLGSIHVPDTVQFLEHYCFAGCAQLTDVTFGPNSQLLSIGNSAFRSTGVHDVNIPNSVIEIGSDVFCGIHTRGRIALFGPCSSLTLIGEYAFRETFTHEFVIPDTVVEIGPYCWQEARGIREITLSGPYSSLCRLHDFAFANVSWPRRGNPLERFVIQILLLK